MKRRPVFGVSFSVKQCHSFGLKYDTVLRTLIKDLGVRRFRLMSYWNEHEQDLGKYDFSVLDKQIDIIEKVKGEITLCLGVRQPRWPENHWPDWAWNLPKPERDAALLKFIEQVVERYKDRSCIVSYQLENEALLEGFGERSEIDRNRLMMEYFWVKTLDKTRPIIMTTSTSWGVPVKHPVPDIVGFSYYQILYRDGKYRRSFHRPWLDRWRARLVRILHDKPSFIHELQAEPWGPKNIWDMDQAEQLKSMSLKQLKRNLRQAKRTKLDTIDLWGAEWWYWLKTKKRQPAIWNEVKKLFSD